MSNRFIVNINHIDPSQDGIDHIWMDLRSKTTLGGMLDSQYVSPFEHPEYGCFNTTEGFWYYISTTLQENASEEDFKKLESFRELNGHNCRKLIGDFRERKLIQRIVVPNFKRMIREATECKLTQNEELLRLFLENKLPFYLYYVKDDKVIRDPNRTWVEAMMTDIHKALTKS